MARGSHAFHAARAQSCVDASVESSSDEESHAEEDSLETPPEIALDTTMETTTEVTTETTTGKGKGPASAGPSNSAARSTGKRKVSAILDPASGEGESDKKSVRSLASSRRSGSKVSSAVALTGVSASIDRLADALEKSLEPQKVVYSNALSEKANDQRMEAIKILSRDLPDPNDQAVMIGLFTENDKLPGIYLALDEEPVRRAWLERMLK
jgi:hypothetical protein